MLVVRSSCLALPRHAIAHLTTHMTNPTLNTPLDSHTRTPLLTGTARTLVEHPNTYRGATHDNTHLAAKPLLSLCFLRALSTQPPTAALQAHFSSLAAPRRRPRLSRVGRISGVVATYFLKFGSAPYLASASAAAEAIVSVA